MTFPVFAGNSASTGYNLTRSLRFRSSASAYLNRTPSVSSSQSEYTLSFWAKRGTLGSNQTLLSCVAYGNTSYQTYFRFNSSDQLEFYNAWGTDLQNIITTQVFRDPSAWYHIVFAIRMQGATRSDAIKLYVNGSLVTAFSTTTYTNAFQATAINAADPHNLCRNVNTSSLYFDGYLAEVNFVNGSQLLPTSFGSFNPTTGVWQPARYTGTYGTNGFYLPFTDNSALTTSSNVGLGKDFSGNGNYWTTNNISITAGVTYDSMTDVPTLTSATAANFAVLNPIGNSSGTISNGNLRSSTSSGNSDVGTMAMQSGKWYWEVTLTTSSNPRIGMYDIGKALPTAVGLGGTNSWAIINGPSRLYYQGTITAYGSFVGSSGSVVMIAYDATNGNLWFGENGTWFASGNPATGASPSLSSVTGTAIVPATSSGSGANVFDYNFGQRPFTYTPPTGFVALNTFNLPTGTIVKGNTVMDATTWTGNGTSQSITNSGAFKPDFVWIKSRSAATYNILTDSVRGYNSQLFSNDTLAQESRTDRLTSFNSNGFSIGNYNDVNTNAATYVGWQWQAGQGTTSTNTNGTITSTVSVNASAGFSIVTYTGTGANATVGHGLGVAPSMYIVKRRNGVIDWGVYHSSLTSPAYGLYLNTNNAQFSAPTYWNSTAPTSSVFSIGTDSLVNASGGTMVAYCWSQIAGFSAFGKYTGNGSSDGPFIFTGFRPKFILIKRTESTANWGIKDTSRNPSNTATQTLFPSLALEEYSVYYDIDILSNGFKCRASDALINASGGTYIYACFAENPFKNSLAR